MMAAMTPASPRRSAYRRAGLGVGVHGEDIRLAVLYVIGDASLPDGSSPTASALRSTSSPCAIAMSRR